jgi:hypothetical protein
LAGVTVFQGSLRITWATLLAATSVTFSVFYFTAQVTNLTRHQVASAQRGKS